MRPIPGTVTDPSLSHLWLKPKDDADVREVDPIIAAIQEALKEQDYARAIRLSRLVFPASQ